MKYHVPVLSEAGSATAEHLGGVPGGLRMEHWPLCKECGRPQSLIAQLDHAADRLDLGRAGRVLFVFQCEWDAGMCATWDAWSGANRCIVAEPEKLTGDSTPPVSPMPPLIGAVGVVRWIERDDGVTADEAPAFFADDRYLALGEAAWAKPTGETRLGSVPHWIQSADETPGSDWRFLGQIDSGYRFADPHEPRPDWVAAPGEGGIAYADGPNFGGGLAYLWSQDWAAGAPRVVMFWQCG